MMQKIRDKAQGIVAWIIVAIIAFVFCFWGISGYLSSGSSSALAEVNGRKITSDEVNEMYNRWLRYASSQKEFDISRINPEQIKQEIVVAAAQQAAVITQLELDGFTISDTTVVEAIRNNEHLQEDGAFSMRLYKDLLTKLNISEAEFETAQREELLVNQIQLAILASSFYIKSEAEHLIALKNQKRSFGYTIVPISKQLAAIKVSDAAVEDFYNKNLAKFVTQDKVQLEYIELSIDDVVKQVPVTDQALQEYYNANLQSFAEPEVMHLRHIMILAPKGFAADKSGEAHEKIEDIYRKLQLGGNFTELAKQDSEDKQTAAKGGDLGWASKNDAYPAEVFALKKDGEYTKPIQSDYGWHIFQLVEIKGGGVKSFAEVKDVVRQRYQRDAAERLFSSKGEELANLTFENPTSLIIASEKLNLPIKTTDFFSKQGGSGIAESPNVLRAAFSDDVYAQQHNSDLVRLSDDSYVVLRVKDKQAARQQTLAEVSADIVKQLQLIAAREQAKQVGDQLLAAIKEGNSPNKAVSSHKLQWHVESDVERDDRKIAMPLLQRVFIMPTPVAGHKFTTEGFSLPNGDYVVVALTAVTNGVLENADDSNLIETVGKQIASLKGRLEFASLQSALIEQAEIKYLTK